MLVRSNPGRRPETCMRVGPATVPDGNPNIRSSSLPRVAAALLLLLLVVGLAFRLWNAWSDIDRLSFTTVPDDSYYYFGIARHLSLGHPPSIDGVHPTN